MKKKRGIFFWKMVLLYTISTTIIFLFFGAAITFYENSKHDREIRELNERALFQSASTCNTTLRNLYNYFYIEILERPELVELLFASQYSQDMSMNFYKLNSSMTNYSSLVESCYVVNLEGGFVCSTFGTYSDLHMFSDQDIIQRLTDDFRENIGEYELVPRNVVYDLNGKQISTRYISMIFRKYTDGYLVVNLDYDAFSDMVNYQNYNKTSQTLLLNSQGTVMIDSNGQLFETSLLEADYYEQMKAKNEEVGFFDAEIDGRLKEICFRKDENFGIDYLTITENQFLDGETFTYILLSSIGAMAINLLFVLCGSLLLYRPIGKISNLLDIESRERVDEFKLLEQTFFQLKKEKKAYSKTKREKLLRNILGDKQLQGEVMQEEMRKLQKKMDRTAFVCVNIYPQIHEESPYEMSLIIFSAENILNELIEGRMVMETVRNDNYLSCVINMDVQEDGGAGILADPNGQGWKACSAKNPFLKNALTRMQKKMKEYFDVDITCAVGNMVNSLDDLSESARNVQMAAFFQASTEESAILYFEELPMRLDSPQNYPKDTVKNLLDAVKNSDKNKIKLCVSEFFSKIGEYSYSQALKSIIMLEIDLAKHETKYEIQRDRDEWVMIDLMQRNGKLYKIRENCLEHCLEAADIYREIKDNNPNMKGIVDKVKAYVDGNITNSDLTVNSIAQSVYLSNSYLRNIFKEVTGSTLSNYIIEKKLEKICGFLENTDLSAQQIADAMGFNSKSYLFTFFKNYTGMTPVQYRNKKKAEK